MGTLTKVGSHNVYTGDTKLDKGCIRALLKDFGAQLVIGHPTLRNEHSIGALLDKGISGAARVFGGKKTAVINVDSTYSEKGGYDHKTIDAALNGAQAALDRIGDDAKNILFMSIPIEGFAGNMVVHKGSALKIIYDEMEDTAVKYLILLDGDLKNDIGEWFEVYQRVFKDFEANHGGKNLFITARYARHFVDASLTRNVVGPLTTLLGKYVPGGISGDIVINAGAARHEREAAWDEARMCYGTDISTTFDNIANGSVIYEVYLGAKLHDVTDDAKLAVMPGEVIGSALERILHYEDSDKRVSSLISSDTEVGSVIAWGPEKTGISFIDPGPTNVFNIEAKREVLKKRYPDFVDDIARVLRPRTASLVAQRHEALSAALENGDDAPLFMDISAQDWTGILYEALGYMLKTRDIDSTKRALNYLYTCAFLEFCRIKLEELGATTVAGITAIQGSLGVPADRAEDFYNNNVDAVVRQLALDFFRGRAAILERMNER